MSDASCKHCGLEVARDHLCKGWSKTSVMQPLRRHREAVEAAVASAEWGQPIAHSDGTRVLREAWSGDGEWHLLIEELTSRTDEKTNTFRGMAESEERNVRVRLSPQLVDQARRKACPAVAGKSE